MFDVEKISPERVDISVTGKITAEEMREGLDALIEESQDLKHGSTLYRIEGFQFPELAALSVEFGKLPELWSMTTRFDRCAVVADAKWLRKVAEIEGFLIPGLKIKGFEPEEEEAWLAA